MYSPTATETFGRCETLWALQQSGYRTDYFGYPNVAAAIGTGIHKGAARVHERVQDMGTAPSLDAWIVEEAVEAALAPLEALMSQGAYPIEKVEDWRERVSLQVTSGTKAYIAQFSSWFDPSWAIVALEESYGKQRGDPAYQGRFDLLYEGDTGLVLADIKTKQPFKSDYYRAMFVGQFQYSWQMYSYAHMVHENTGSYPSQLALIMMEMKGRPIVSLHEFRFDLEYYKRWLLSAERRWSAMEAVENGEAVPSIADTHFFFGQPCQYKKACLDYGCDEHLMLNDGYIKLPEENEGA